MLVERLEHALRQGILRMDCHAHALLLVTLFPEEFAEEPAGEPTDTPPLTDERIAVYAQREAEGRPIKHPLDACPVRDDGRVLTPKPGQPNVMVFRALGWAQEIGPAGEEPQDGGTDGR